MLRSIIKEIVIPEKGGILYNKQKMDPYFRGDDILRL